MPGYSSELEHIASLLEKIAGEDSDQGQDQQDQSQDGQDQSQGQQQDPISELTDIVSQIADQVKDLKYELNKVKSSIIAETTIEDPDLNTTVLSNKNLMRKQAFLQIMDQLNDVSDAIVASNPHISKRIDSIMDCLRFYDKVK